MTFADLQPLLPIIVLAASTVLTMLVVAFHRSHALTAALTVAGFAVAIATLPIAAGASKRQVTPLVAMDDYALFFIGVMLAASLAVVLLSFDYLSRQDEQPEEYYLLLTMATLGSAVLAASTHFASFFLGLEVLSVSLYTMIGYLRIRCESIEASAKYLVLAGASSAFLLFGMALAYTETGTLEFGRMMMGQAGAGPRGELMVAGLLMLLVGIGFKLAVVPFHLWTPDVYEGAPAPATAFVATVSKGAMVALVLRLFTQVDIHALTPVFVAVSLIAIASMLVGNLLALLQANVKRILAYSSISHLGYILVAFLATGPLAATAVAFYVVAYFATTLAAFGVVTVLSGADRDADDLEDYRGLIYRRPWLAAGFTAALLSLAGIPLTAGFVGKFYLVAAGVSYALWGLVVVLVLASGIGLFYYLRIATIMYARPAEVAVATVPSTPVLGGVALVVLTVLVVWLGVYPSPLLDLIQPAVRGFM